MKPFFGKGKSSGGWGDKRGNAGGGYRGGSTPQMHHATCAACDVDCEVPFRPNGEKPVYCRDCFRKNDTQAPRFERSERSQSFEKPASRGASSMAGSDEIVKQLRTLNKKMDTLIQVFLEDDEEETEESES